MKELMTDLQIVQSHFKGINGQIGASGIRRGNLNERALLMLDRIPVCNPETCASALNLSCEYGSKDDNSNVRGRACSMVRKEFLPIVINLYTRYMSIADDTLFDQIGYIIVPNIIRKLTYEHGVGLAGASEGRRFQLIRMADNQIMQLERRLNKELPKKKSGSSGRAGVINL